MGPSDRWPRPPAPPIARMVDLVEVVPGHPTRQAGVFAVEVLPGDTAEIHFRPRGVDEDGERHPVGRVAFGPAHARELLRDLAAVVAGWDEAAATKPAHDRAPGTNP